MMEPKREFEVVAEDGQRFVVVEFRTLRWERDRFGERQRVENDATLMFTECGCEVTPTGVHGSYHIQRLELMVRLVDETTTLTNVASVLDR